MAAKIPLMLTKSDLLSMVQCPRRLWLEKKSPELIPTDDPTLYRRAVDGQIVAEKAREQLGKKLIWPRREEDPAQTAAAAKALLSAKPDLPGVEIPMVHEGLYARADALIPLQGGYLLRETKAASFPLKDDKVTPGAAEEHHLLDLAIQVWVMEGWGVPAARAELNLLNSQWRYAGDGDYSGLFRMFDATESVKELKSLVPELVSKAKILVEGERPDAVTGRQCDKPNPCPFVEHCRKHDPPGPEHPIELLPDSAGKGLAKKLKQAKGYTSILEPAPEELAGKQASLYRRIQAAHRTGQAILDPGSSELLKDLSYPRYYFDFEGIDLPVPRWKGARPYEQIPFQWSCHVEVTAGCFEHAEFLDLSGDDPSPACIAKMIEVLKPDQPGPIFVYFATYERGRIVDLAARFPEHSADLTKLVGRLYDLLPVVKNHYYHPQMKGSFSIKKVLPVIAPDVSYADLAEVNEGTAAQVAYLYAALDPSTSAGRKADLEAKLRKYCRQDTWAMVEVAYFLAGTGRPARPADM